MQKIELNSLKLPCEFWSFKDKIENEAVVTQISVTIRAYVKEPKHRVYLNGYIAEKGITAFYLNRNKPRYMGTIHIKDTKVNLALLYRDIEQTMQENNLIDHTLEVKSAMLLIDTKLHMFKFHAPAKALTLKAIEHKPIGKLEESKISEMVAGRYAFCQSSKCYKKYTEKWYCE